MPMRLVTMVNFGRLHFFDSRGGAQLDSVLRFYCDRWIERLASAIDSEPVPVIRMHVVLMKTTRSRALSQVPVKLRRHRHFFALCQWTFSH